MNIAVIGANGMVGSAVVAEAAARGHQVTAYSQSGRTTTDAAQVTAAQLDFADTAAVASAIDAHDLTVIAVAGRDDYAAVKAAHLNLIAAAPIGRILVVGGAGALIADGKRLLESPDFPAEYLTEATTFAEVYDAYVASTGLNWTLIAPSPMIAPGVRTGNYVEGLDSPAGNFVSAEDFAVAIIDEAEASKHLGYRFTVASSDEAAAQG